MGKKREKKLHQAFMTFSEFYLAAIKSIIGREDTMQKVGSLWNSS